MHRDYLDDPGVTSFVKWVRSEEGQSVIVEAETVPITDTTSETWARYLDHMTRGKQDYESLLRIIGGLGNGPDSTREGS